MKVLNLSTTDSGGASIACIRLHEALLKNGIESSLVTLNKQRKDIVNHNSYFESLTQEKPVNKNLAQRLFSKLSNQLNKKKQKIEENLILEKKQLVSIASKLTDCYSLIESPYRINKLKNFLDNDIVNLHWVADFLDWESFFSTIGNKPLVWTLHDMSAFTGGYHYASGFEGYKSLDQNDPFSENTSLKGYTQEQLLEKIKIFEKYKPNLIIVSPSQWLKEQSESSTLLKKFKHICIPYSLDENKFKILSQQSCRHVLNLPENKKIILFVSEWIDNYRKGFDLLLQAFNNMEDADVVLCSIGGKMKAQELTNNKNFINLGNINDERLMNIAYNAADLFVLPSREDNLPNVIMESLFCGTPVVAFNIGGIPDMVINGFNGYLSNEITSRSLYDTIHKALNNLNSFNREEIRNNVTNKYSQSNQAKAYLDIYSSFK